MQCCTTGARKCRPWQSTLPCTEGAEIQRPQHQHSAGVAVSLAAVFYRTGDLRAGFLPEALRASSRKHFMRDDIEAQSLMWQTMPEWRPILLHVLSLFFPDRYGYRTDVVPTKFISTLHG